MGRLLGRVFVLAMLVSAFALGARPTFVSAQGSVADTLRALEIARGQALMKGDTAAIARMTANEFVEIARTGQLRTKADNLREVGSGGLKLTRVRFDSTSVQVYGDVAVLRSIADNTGTFRGFPFAGRVWITRIFVKRDGRWQAVAMQHTPIP